MRFLIGSLFLFSCLAATAADGEYHTQARFISDHKVIAKGEPFLLGVHLTMENHWHTYWENPGFSGLPTTLSLAPIEGLKVEPLQFPFPSRYEDEYGFVTFGYDSEVLLIARAVYEGSAEEIELAADINWLECKELCINGQKKDSLKLAVGTSQPDNGDLFKKYQEKIPVNFGENSPFTFDATIDFKADAWTGTLNIKPVTADWSNRTTDFSFFPLKPASDIAELKKSELSIKDGIYSFTLNWEAFEAVSEDQLVAGVLKYTSSAGTGYSRINLWPAAAVTEKATAASIDPAVEDKGVVEPPASGFERGFWYFALMALIGGIILNLMPCVLPVLSLKVFALISDAGESALARTRNAWIYTLGIMASFLVMSLFFALSKVFGEQVGIGFQLSNPSFVVFMSVLLFVMGLSFFGVFEFGAPNSNKLASLSQKSGPQGAFFMGVLMTLLSTPCTAPFLGVAYGWALSQKIIVILIIFQIIALGLALPYVVLCYMPALLKLLPKPGPWMQHMKVGMGFLMLGTMVWLMSVLAGLSGPDAIIGLLTLLIPIGLGAYFIGVTWYTSSRLTGIVFTLLLAAGGYHLGMRDLFQLSNPYASRDQRKEALRLELMANGGINNDDLFSELEKKVTTADQIAWVPYSSETLEYFRNKNRLVFLDFTAEWCLTCKTNERLVINTAATRKLFAENNVVVMRGDYTEQKEEHTRFINSFQRAGVPLYVVYPGNGEPILLPETITRGIVADSVTEAAIQLKQAVNLKPGF